MGKVKEYREELLDAGFTEVEIEEAVNMLGFEVVDKVPVKKVFHHILDEMRTIHHRKNTDYGNSFDKSLDEDGLLVAKIRLGDKYSRFGQLIKNDAMVSDESIRDTLIDMANYAAMTVLWLDNNGHRPLKDDDSYQLTLELDGNIPEEYREWYKQMEYNFEKAKSKMTL